MGLRLDLYIEEMDTICRSDQEGAVVVGARPDQQLALNFLSAIHSLWLAHPGTYAVRETVDDLVPSLAQMSIKALASDLRDVVPSGVQTETVAGWLSTADGRQPLCLRDALNKIIHGSPTLVEVDAAAIWLHFSNNTPSAGHSWDRAAVSATDVLRLLETRLFKHSGEAAQRRERSIEALLSSLGSARFLPTPQR